MTAARPAIGARVRTALDTLLTAAAFALVLAAVAGIGPFASRIDATGNSLAYAANAGAPSSLFADLLP